MPSGASAAASNPHSGQGRSSTHVQSLSSGTIGMLQGHPIAVEPREQVRRGHARTTRRRYDGPARRRSGAPGHHRTRRAGRTPPGPSARRGPRVRSLRRSRASPRTWRPGRARASALRRRGPRAPPPDSAWCRRGPWPGRRSARARCWRRAGGPTRPTGGASLPAACRARPAGRPPSRPGRGASRAAAGGGDAGPRALRRVRHGGPVDVVALVVERDGHVQRMPGHHDVGAVSRAASRRAAYGS